VCVIVAFGSFEGEKTDSVLGSNQKMIFIHF